MRAWPLAAVILGAALAVPAHADIALSSNDSHTMLVNGAQVAPPEASADTLSVIDLAQTPPKVTDTIEVPGSVVGPPTAVAVSKDETFAIVTAATRADPAGTAGISPDNRLTVVDLTAKPPMAVQHLRAGAGAASVRISPDGTLALVANRFAGTVSVFTINDRRLTPAGTVQVGPGSMPSGIAFSGDGKSALVTRYGDNQVMVLNIDGRNVTADPRPVTTGVAPYTIDTSPDGTLAAVSNMGRGDGDADTVSLIDLSTRPFRTIHTQTVGRSPEGLRWAPDGRFLAVATQEGTTKPAGDPFLGERGRLSIYELADRRLRPVAEAPIGHWSQGIAFSRDSRTVLVQNMVERSIQVFRWDGAKLWPGVTLDMGAGPAAIGTAWP
ncbi:MAG TPA: beta-propeller fold lactonase family protein [Acetobacteraceae bacterium]